jgi:Ni,Fe-hydrogenase III large subunit
LLLRAVQAALGQRYLLDAIVPGGVAFDLDASGRNALQLQLASVAASSRMLREIYDEHAGVRDRFVGAGRVAPDLARRLGLTGLAGRASGQDRDLRVDQPCSPYERLGPRKCVHTEGDVAARVAVRFDELQESCRLAQLILGSLPEGPVHLEPMIPGQPALAIGLIEGWRGPVMMAIESGAQGAIARCHPHDSSWQNWPVLEHAIIDNIVPDFPLINKSFNLSYSGHDL